MKYILLALIATSALALSPNTPVSHQYDDALYNNIGEQFKNFEATAEIHTTAPLLPVLSKVQIMRHCSVHMEDGDYEKAAPVIASLVEKAKVAHDSQNFHALFLSMDYKIAQMRTYELTIHRNTNTLVAILALKTHEIEENQEKESFYYETYDSPFGFPFINIEKAPVTDSEITEELIQYSKQYLLRAAQIQRGSSVLLGNFGNAAAFVKTATEGVKQVASAYTEVAKAFKTTISDTITKSIKGKGFSKYRSTSRVLRSLGVPKNQFNNYMKSFKTLTGMYKSKYKAELDAILTSATFTVTNDWSIKDFSFNDAKRSTVDAAICLTRTDTKVMHFVTTVTSGFFNLAPNILIMTNHLSAAGGIFERKKDYFKAKPRSLGAKEIKKIQALMIVNSLNMMTKEFGLKMTLPDDPTKMPNSIRLK